MSNFIFIPWVVHMHDMVTLGRDGYNALDSGNHIAALMSGAHDPI